MKVDPTLHSVIAKTPKLYKDTDWEKLSDGSYYLKNKDFIRSFIVSEYVIKFLKLATGGSTIKEICDQVGINASPKNIKKIHDLYYVDLYPLGVLEEEEIKIKKKKSDIKFSFTIIPEKGVVFLSKYFKFFFEKKIAILSLSFSVIISCIGVGYFYSLESSLNITENSDFVLIGLLLIPVFFIHELGHSSALYFFRETPRKIGIGLFLFAPVLFADVTDAWKLKRKQRMIVDIGGLYFQYIVSNLYILFFLISTNISFLSSALFSLLIGALNLNPFIKMDGYWLFSDFMDISNLKQKAKTRTLSIIQGIFTKEKFSYKSNDITFIVYYVLNLLFTIAFVTYMLFWNVELFMELPRNIENLFLGILEGNYYNIDIISLESIILPFIVIFLVLNITITVLMRKMKKLMKVRNHMRKAHNTI